MLVDVSIKEEFGGVKMEAEVVVEERDCDGRSTVCLRDYRLGIKTVWQEYVTYDREEETREDEGDFLPRVDDDKNGKFIVLVTFDVGRTDVEVALPASCEEIGVDISLNCEPVDEKVCVSPSSVYASIE